MPPATPSTPSDLSYCDARLNAFSLLLVRHRSTIGGLLLILVGTLLALYHAYKVDIFPNEGGVAEHHDAIELDEALLVRGLVTLALLTFGVRQYLAQKREMAKRIRRRARSRDERCVRRVP